MYLEYIIFLFSTVEERQAVYVGRNIEVFPCNLFCRGKTTSITYCKCVRVFVALGI